MSRLMVRTLNDLGYHVYLYHYLDENIDYSISYDLFIGHNKTFYKIADKLPKPCRRILLTTGCSPEFDNLQLSQRNRQLQKRKQTTEEFYTPSTEVAHAKMNCSIATHIFMIGSPFIQQYGWYPEALKKITRYNNVSLFEPRLKETNSKVFVFMSGIGQLRRGLDLVLEVFSHRHERIYICAPFDLEPQFVRSFKRELFETKNIIPVGFVNQRSAFFKEIIQEADFAVLPSCSEGQSGSLLNLMAHGLIPVATKHTGFEELEEVGIEITDFTPDALNQAIDAALCLSQQQKDEKRNKIFSAFTTRYSEAAFQRVFTGFIEKVNTSSEELR